MTKRKKQKPADIAARLEKLARARGEAMREKLRLESTGAEAEIVGDGTEVRARRIDVFQLLLERKAIPLSDFNAVRLYEQDVALSMGWETPERGEFVNRSCEGAPGQNITQAMIEASRRVEWVRAWLSQRDYALLTGLLEDHGALLTRWRNTVSRVTGEHREECHAAAIRAMAANLRDVIGRLPPSGAVAIAA